tara:strand:- start:381 stop:872 length:492 start_codon:yes stop_codon:yes gene_type:complete
MIEVYDDFFDDDIHQEVYSKLMRPNWGISGNNPGKLEIFWHYEGLENEEYFSEYLYEKICNKLDTEFKGFERIYANGQTAGQYGTPHYDDGDLTFLYYPSPVWDTNWQGHLMFMNETDEVVRVVEHKSNRAVLFTGIIKHYADAPHRWFNGLRISLAYKLWKK